METYHEKDDTIATEAEHLLCEWADFLHQVYAHYHLVDGSDGASASLSPPRIQRRHSLFHLLCSEGSGRTSFK